MDTFQGTVAAHRLTDTRSEDKNSKEKSMVLSPRSVQCLSAGSAHTCQ